ncbi:MAG: porin family protein [Aureibaculum sp.]|nr:porin family protein [Aureibaculum sp.]
MKKLLIFTAIALFGFTNVNAQEEMQFGVKGGLNISTITGDDVESFDSRTCMHFGVVMELPISDKFSFQPELLYSCQGADYSEDFGDFDVTVKSVNAAYEGTVKLDYLNIPLMAKFYVAEGFSLEVGPQVGFLISAKEEYDWDGDTGEDDIKESVKGLDIGAVMGLGYKLEGGLNFGARYNIGLSDANDDPDYLGDSSYKNSVMQVFVGYFF